MVLKRIIDIKDKKERNKIYIYAERKKLKKYVDEEGYVCFNKKEFEQYKQKAKIGRPAKIEKDI